MTGSGYLSMLSGPIDDQGGTLMFRSFVCRGCLLAIGILACQPGAASNRADPTGFERAGVIEGFYGPPWSHQDRIDVLRFMGRVGLNAYIYAPKDDPYHRERWREPYPAVALAQVRELVDTARASGVEFWYAISPGGSMVYADSAEYRALIRKIDAMAALGITRFGLFLDDVLYELLHDADRRAYANSAQAHADLANRLLADLRARSAELVLTPTTYTEAWGSREYLEELGRLVDPAVPFFWTGPDVASPTIARAHAERWLAMTGDRPLWLWDNYPVNDYARWRLFLGPLTGRSADLAQRVPAIFANPMNEAHASMIALATLAEYARNPAAYDPIRARRTAHRVLYGEAVADATTSLASVYGDYGWQPNVFEPLFILQDTIDVEAIGRSLDTLEAALTRLAGLESTGLASVRPLIEETRPFLERTRRRLRELEANPDYERRGALRVYRAVLDRYAAPAVARVKVDGRLGEWGGARWHALRTGAARANHNAEVAFGSGGDTLYVAVRVRDPAVDGRTGLHVGVGDHLLLVVDADPADEPYGLSSADPVIIVSQAGGDSAAYVGALKFEGFMSKWLADNENLTFGDFHLSSFPLPPPDAARGARYAVTTTTDGWVAEIALPTTGAAARLNLSVTDAGRPRRTVALARRNYAGNPATFVEVTLNRP